MTRVYIVGAKRTAIGKFGGALSTVKASDLGGYAIKGALLQDPADLKVDQVLMGSVLQAGQGQNPARQASQFAGLGDEVPAVTINDVCGSGLTSINMAASLIQSGQAQVVVAGGMENMSQAPFALDRARFGYRMGDGQLTDLLLRDALEDANGGFHMGITAENIAERYAVSRADMDTFALESHQRAVAAQKAGRFADEIIPVPVVDRRGEKNLVSQDEGPRPDTSLAKLAGLKPAFKPEGRVTAGNASGINDAAAAVLLVSEEVVQTYGLTPLAEWQAASLVGLDPKFMGLGPYYAVEDLLKKPNTPDLDQIDVLELNEAFAAQAVATNRLLALDPARVNPNGGAIALGHPVGASGARILVTLLYEMQDLQAEFGLAALCIGGGMGAATLLKQP